MKTYLTGVSQQIFAILIAAAAAAAFTFFHSLATQTGVCMPPTDTAVQAGALGATFKAMHTAFSGLVQQHTV